MLNSFVLGPMNGFFYTYITSQMFSSFINVKIAHKIIIKKVLILKLEVSELQMFIS